MDAKNLFDLSILMMERVGLIILLAFLLVNVPYFKQILLNRGKVTSVFQLILFFGFFAIISNFIGIEISNNQIIQSNVLTYVSPDASIANTRTLAINVAGLVGGPIVGASVGLIAGIHRVLQGSGSGLFYIVSSFIIGIISGSLGLYLTRDKRFPSPSQGVIVGAIMEIIQMTFIFLFTGTIAEGLALVRLIGFPMILLNSVGAFIFLSILTITLNQEEQAKAVQTHDVLTLAAETLPYFREGLKKKPAQAVAKIIKHYTKVSAISITDSHQILAHVGAGSDHHIPEVEVITELSKKVLSTGDLTIAHHHDEIGCSFPNCPLEAAIVIPLVAHDNIVGTLKFYFTDTSELTHVEEQLAEGLATIFTSQIELGEAELQSKLLKDAEIKALQSQVNPHFFFNAINTISALMRKDSEKARQLLMQLTTYFRRNLQGARHTLIPLSSEMDQVEAYLKLDQARFPNRYHIDIEIDEQLNDILVPPFSVQLLVENAIKHAFKGSKEANQIYVNIQKKADELQIKVQDNGKGIDPNLLAYIGKEEVESEQGTGTALENLVKRLDSLFGKKGYFKASNLEEGGAEFIVRFPIIKNETDVL